MTDLGTSEQATGLVREFREQPTPELARSATAGITSTLSPNARTLGPMIGSASRTWIAVQLVAWV